MVERTTVGVRAPGDCDLRVFDKGPMVGAALLSLAGLLLAGTVACGSVAVFDEALESSVDGAIVVAVATPPVEFWTPVPETTISPTSTSTELAATSIPSEQGEQSSPMATTTPPAQDATSSGIDGEGIDGEQQTEQVTIDPASTPPRPTTPPSTAGTESADDPTPVPSESPVATSVPEAATAVPKPETPTSSANSSGGASPSATSSAAETGAVNGDEEAPINESPTSGDAAQSDDEQKVAPADSPPVDGPRSGDDETAASKPTVSPSGTSNGIEAGESGVGEAEPTGDSLVTGGTTPVPIVPPIEVPVQEDICPGGLLANGTCAVANSANAPCSGVECAPDGGAPCSGVECAPDGDSLCSGVECAPDGDSLCSAADCALGYDNSFGDGDEELFQRDEGDWQFDGLGEQLRQGDAGVGQFEDLGEQLIQRQQGFQSQDLTPHLQDALGRLQELQRNQSASPGGW